MKKEDDEEKDEIDDGEKESGGAGSTATLDGYTLHTHTYTQYPRCLRWRILQRVWLQEASLWRDFHSLWVSHPRLSTRGWWGTTSRDRCLSSTKWQPERWSLLLETLRFRRRWDLRRNFSWTLCQTIPEPTNLEADVWTPGEAGVSSETSDSADTSSEHRRCRGCCLVWERVSGDFLAFPLSLCRTPHLYIRDVFCIELHIDRSDEYIYYQPF